MRREIWYVDYYVPREDGGELGPAMALIGVPFLLIILLLLLGSLTVLKGWDVAHYLTSLVRIPLAVIAMLFSLIATLFFIGQPQAVLS